MTVSICETYQPEIIRESIWKYGLRPITLAPNVAGAIRGNFSGDCKVISNGTHEGAGDDPRYIRMLVWSYLASPEDEPFRIKSSSKEIGDGFIYGFGRWQTEKLPSGIYQKRSAFLSELQWVLYRARHDYKRQQENPDLVLGDLLQEWKDESPFGDGESGMPIASMFDFAKDLVANPPSFTRAADVELPDVVPQATQFDEIVNI